MDGGQSKIEGVTAACRRCGEPFVKHEGGRHFFCSSTCAKRAADEKRRDDLAAIRLAAGNHQPKRVRVSGNPGISNSRGN